MIKITAMTVNAEVPQTDALVTYASFVIIALVSILLYIIAVSDWLPSLLMVKRHGAITLRDRGLEKFTYPEGRGVLYEPAGFDNRFLRKYILFAQGERKYLKCRFADRVRSAYCEIFVFDNQNKLIKIVDIFLEPDQDRNARAVVLPEDTSYVSILVLKVNGRDVKLSKADKKSYSEHLKQRRGLFALLCVAVSVAEGLILTYLIRYFLDIFMLDSFGMTFESYVGHSGRLFDILISAIAGLVVAGFGILLHLKKDRI